MRRSQAPSKRSVQSVNVPLPNTANRIANVPIQSAIQTSAASAAKRQRMIESSAGSTVQRYFVVVWRKQTLKKTWDGDAYMRVNDQQAIVMDNRQKGLAKLSAGQIQCFDEGCEFSSSGKDFEISREISKAEYERETGEGTNEDEIVPIEQPKLKSGEILVPLLTLCVSLPRFKAHNKLPPGPPVSHYSIQPRHDPSNPHSLTLSRPSNDYVVQYNKRNRPLVDVVVDPVVGQHLRDHQKEGVVFMYECLMDMKNYGGEGVLLADEMGLGKTLQSCLMFSDLVLTVLEQTPFSGDPPIVKKALIVCPTSLIENWKKEFKKWLGDERISVYVVDQKSEVRDFLHSNIYSAMIIGYEKLRNMESDLEDAAFDIIICDEGHRLKNQNIKTLQVISAMPANKRIILSGTPRIWQNHLEEFWCMINFLNPNILGKYSYFKKMYETPINQSRQPNSSKEDLELGTERADELLEVVSKFVLRRNIDAIAKYLKPKVEYVLFCRPSILQQQLYRRLLWSASWLDIAHNRAGFLGCITALKKVSNCPTLVYESMMTGGHQVSIKDSSIFSDMECLEEFPKDFDGRQINHKDSGKLNVLVELLSNIRQHTKEKVVVVSNYTQTLDILEVMCDANNYLYYRLDGQTPAAQRQTTVDHFNRQDDDRFIFLLSAKSGGVGLNLTGASRLILFDPDWNPSVDKQVMARIYRDGQRHIAHIYRLLTTGTIDEKIFQRQLNKHSLSESIIGLNDEPSADHFTKNQIRDLFRLDTETYCQTHDLLDCQCSASSKAMDDTHNEQPFVTKNDIKSLAEWKHVLISEDTTDSAILGISDSVLSQVLLAYREQSDNIVSFIMYHGEQ
ncbi:hypothetical protein INT43_007999 [Umbelopsis isabellina]|uniref:DNA repair and recombination protein RAD54B n=1 Tax=Mortierella isabellina TaxID=91625 RepID=A0A8H7PNH5_MORIS|nr:hypothetical protein INT43_007999 [Umbelopsis isabellina]